MVAFSATGKRPNIAIMCDHVHVVWFELLHWGLCSGLLRCASTSSGCNAASPVHMPSRMLHSTWSLIDEHLITSHGLLAQRVLPCFHVVSDAKMTMLSEPAVHVVSTSIQTLHNRSGVITALSFFWSENHATTDCTYPRAPGPSPQVRWLEPRGAHPKHLARGSWEAQG